MALVTIPPFGQAEVLLLAGEAICVASRGRAVIASKSPASSEKVLESANPDPIFAVNNSENVSAVFASGGRVLVENTGPFVAYIEKGTAPLSKDWRNDTERRGAPLTLNASGTITSAMILSGALTSNAAASIVGTLEAGAVADAASSWDIGEGMTWGVSATGAGGFAVTASAGHTVSGSGVVATATSAMFRTVKTAAATFVTTRIG